MNKNVFFLNLENLKKKYKRNSEETFKDDDDDDASCDSSIRMVVNSHCEHLHARQRMGFSISCTA